MVLSNKVFSPNLKSVGLLWRHQFAKYQYYALNLAAMKKSSRVDYLNDLDKLRNPITKQARRNINNTQEWKRTHHRMEEARLRAESYQKSLRKKRQFF